MDRGGRHGYQEEEVGRAVKDEPSKFPENIYLQRMMEEVQLKQPAFE